MEEIRDRVDGFLYHHPIIDCIIRLFIGFVLLFIIISLILLLFGVAITWTIFWKGILVAFLLSIGIICFAWIIMG